jgi:type II secretory pathway component PulF
VCPVLGCRPAVILAVRLRAARASWWDLVFWLGSYALLYAMLASFIPRVTRIYEKKKSGLPGSTHVVMDLANFARSNLGLFVVVLIAACVVVVFLKLRDRPSTGIAFGFLTLAQGLVAGIAVFFALIPLVNIVRV